MKRIVMPNRDSNGWLHGTKIVDVEWKCPKCRCIMGEPELRTFCEDGEFYSVHVWKNECEHLTKYADLQLADT